ncbi:kinase-associated lipoprotein B [Bacillus sp. FJAT-45066]|uniref:kinase-associated lipoprotein B n=1 Tax=Bacillus sp. FJAT-45066 TaxID=2011010 RepID=UPI000BB7B48E|nr:kinase-associated lipoprotein B [Bacillus sp. FJAT-45066]
MTELKIGDKVTGIYKTGKYIGEITDVKPMHYLVKVLAVEKHPQQGDLHSPKDVDVPLFHERKALAFREQTNIPKNMVKLYEGEILEYKESLVLSLEKMEEKLKEENSNWAKRSLENVQVLKKDYKLN